MGMIQTVFYLILPVFWLGCTSAYEKSLGGDTEQVFARIYVTDFDTAWIAVKDSVKSYPVAVDNRESGFLQTKFTDNTSDKNFFDSFGGQKSYLKSQFRFLISVGKAGTYQGKSAVKVAVQKEQLVQKDVLEGFRAVGTDSVEEKTLLYRIGRLIYLKTELSRAEESRIQKEMESSEFK